MRLLHTTAFDLQVFMPEHVPDYVILSHRWCNQEVLFEDFILRPLSDLDHPARSKIGFEKVLGACKLAHSDGYDWIWIDSCCMDKSSSSELQEAINSMWTFYSNANICYVYMMDVPDEEAGWDGTFQKSSWFDRGWTLQELIAPSSVEFYAADWSPIGTKAQRQEEISARTNIGSDALLITSQAHAVSTALKFSWAAHRQVTREEDQAYSLLGLFQVNMPMLYGEGGAKAYGRLQEAIYSATRDDTMFLFRYSSFTHDRFPLISDSPDRFCQSEGCVKCQRECWTCLPPTIRYEHMHSTYLWSRQPHEQLITTITANRFEATTVLMLLPAQEIYNELANPGDLDRLRKLAATHVAVLNYTCASDKNTSLCIPLYRQRPHEGVSVRAAAYPVLIRDVEKLIPKMQERKVLFAFKPIVEKSHSHLEQPVELIFQVEGESCMASSWITTDPDPNSPTAKIIGKNTLTVRATGWALMPSQISFNLAEGHDLKNSVPLLLRRNEQVWLITEKTDELDSMPLGKDRSTFAYTPDKQMMVSIRRLSALQRPLTAEERARKVFKILVRPLALQSSAKGSRTTSDLALRPEGKDVS